MNALRWLSVVAVAALAHQGSAFPLPLEQPMHFEGSHWSEDRPDSPLTATAVLRKVGKGDFGTALELRFETSDPARVIEPLQFVVTPEGAIYAVGFGERQADLRAWLRGEGAPDLTLAELRLPARDPETGAFRGPFGAGVSWSSESVVFSRGNTSTSVRLNPARDVALYSTFHAGNSNFGTLVFQRNAGIVRVARGSGAHREGWELSRVFSPAEKVPKSPDLARLFVALPVEALPDLGSLDRFKDPSARRALWMRPAKTAGASDQLTVRVHRNRLEIRSGTVAGEDVLEAGSWIRRNGSRLLLLLTKRRIGDSVTMRDVRLFEYRDGKFRLATFSDLPLSARRDFTGDTNDRPETGSFVTGLWVLPTNEKAIIIRPGTSQEMGEGNGSTAKTNRALELRWDGDRFEVARIRHP